jgi:molybdopterin synthase sulfur carrier subunit
MKINFYATFRPIVGGKTVEFDLQQNLTVRQLVDVIVSRFPAMAPKMLDASGDIYSHVHIFVNGRDACYLDDGYNYILHTEDTLNIFPPVGGG